MIFHYFVANLFHIVLEQQVETLGEEITRCFAIIDTLADSLPSVPPLDDTLQELQLLSDKNTEAQDSFLETLRQAGTCNTESSEVTR